MKLFPTRQKITNPFVIYTAGYKSEGLKNVAEKQIVGSFYNVVPETEREVLALQLAEHQVEKFAPARVGDQTGNGVIVSAQFLAKLQS